MSREYVYRPIFDLKTPHVVCYEVLFSDGFDKLVKWYDAETDRSHVDHLGQGYYRTEGEARAVLVAWLGKTIGELSKALAAEIAEQNEKLNRDVIPL